MLEKEIIKAFILFIYKRRKRIKRENENIEILKERKIKMKTVQLSAFSNFPEQGASRVEKQVQHRTQVREKEKKSEYMKERTNAEKLVNKIISKIKKRSERSN